MTLTAWGLALSFVGASLFSVTSLRLKAHGEWTLMAGPTMPWIRRWGPVLGWALIVLGFGVQFLGEWP